MKQMLIRSWLECVNATAGGPVALQSEPPWMTWLGCLAAFLVLMAALVVS